MKPMFLLVAPWALLWIFFPWLPLPAPIPMKRDAAALPAAQQPESQ